MSTFCADTIEIWKLVGSVVTILKIAIPIIIIVMAIVDLGKAAVSNDDKEMNNAFKKLLRRVIAGVVIFFIPTIVNLAFNLVGEFSSAENDYGVCSACVAGGDCYIASGCSTNEDGQCYGLDAYVNPKVSEETKTNS